MSGNCITWVYALRRVLQGPEEKQNQNTHIKLLGSTEEKWQIKCVMQLTVLFTGKLYCTRFRKLPYLSPFHKLKKALTETNFLKVKQHVSGSKMGMDIPDFPVLFLSQTRLLFMYCTPRSQYKDSYLALLHTFPSGMIKKTKSTSWSFTIPHSRYYKHI